MKRGITTLLIVVATIFLTACAQPEIKTADVAEESTEPETPIEDQITETEDTTSEVSTEVTIEITADGFSPDSASVTSGTTVTWVNMDTEEHWPASAVHPTHTAYPTTGGCIGSTFDACDGIAQGENWSFRFDEVGEWKYHDHLNPSNTGTITVV